MAIFEPPTPHELNDKSGRTNEPWWRWFTSVYEDIKANRIGTNVDYYGGLERAIARIGTSQSFTIIVSTAQTITANLTIPSNITLMIKQGGIISGAYTLTINGSFEAGLYQVFGSDVTVDGLTGTAYPEWWGIDGVDDDVQINAAAASGVKEVVLQATTYQCDEQVTLPANVNLTGQGRENTLLDFYGATGAFSGGGCVYAAGTAPTLIGTLDANILVSTRTVTCSVAPSVSEGDIIFIYDTDDYSWSGWRNVYRAGEMGEAAFDSGAGYDITLKTATYAAYTAGANVQIYKMPSPTSSIISNLGVKAPATGNESCIKIIYGNGAGVDNVKTWNSDNANISINKSYNFTVNRVHSHLLAKTVGTCYGVVVVNSQGGIISHSDILSTRHGVAIGGDNTAPTVVNRAIVISDNVIGNYNVSLGCVDCHGNSEHIFINDNILSGGVNPAGNKITISNNKIRQSTNEANGYCIYLTEPAGLDFNIHSNEMYANVPPNSGRGIFLEVGGNSTVLSTDMPNGGTLTFKGNKCYYTNADSQFSGVVIKNRGNTESLNFVISDNEFIGTVTSIGHKYAVDFEVVSGSAFEKVEIKNNYCYGFGLYVSGGNAVNVSGNYVINSGLYGINVAKGSVIAETPEWYVVQDNYIYKSYYAGVYINGNTADGVVNVVVVNNRILENNIGDTGAGATNYGLNITYVTTARINGNVIGGTGVNAVGRLKCNTITTLNEWANEYYGTGTQSYASVTTTNGFRWEDDVENFRFTNPLRIDDNASIGVAADSKYKLYISNLAVNTTDTYYGIYNYHKKTAGATNSSDDLYGLSNRIQLDQAGGTIGEFRGMYNYNIINDGTIAVDANGVYSNLYFVGGVSTGAAHGATFILQSAGGGGTFNSDAIAIKSSMDLDAGTFGASIYGDYIDVDIESGVTSIDGSVYGQYIQVDADKNPTGSVYMLYLKELTNIDYCIYQDGIAPNVLGGNLFINTVKSGATQAAAGAAANEVWKTASHATLPDNVLMIGV